MRRQGILERATEVIEKIAGLLLGLITIIVVVSAVGRYFFSWPIPDAFDLSRYLLGAAIMWGFASVAYRGSHIKVDVIAEMLGPRTRRIIDLFAWTVLLFFTILLAWKLFQRVVYVYGNGEATMDLRIPSWPFVFLIWAGVAVSIIGILARMVRIAVYGEGLDHFEDTESVEIVEARNRD